MKQLSLKAGYVLLFAFLTACNGGGAGVASGPPQTDSGISSSGIATSEIPSTSTTPSSLTTLATAPRVPDAAARSLATAASAAGFAVDCGSSSAAGGWAADTFSNSGWNARVSNVIDVSRVSNPAPQSVYQTQRTGVNFTYTLPNLTPNESYTVRLHFVESFWRANGKRIFNVSIGSSQVLTNFDVYQSAGGANIALVKEYKANADASGRITVHLSATVDNASIAGIEVNNGTAVAASTPVPVPVPVPVSLPQSGWQNVFPGFAGNRRLSPNPAIHPQSQQMMSTLYNDSSSLTAPGVNDDTATFYSAKSSDPLHYIHCTNLWGPAPSRNCVMEGKQINVPNGAATAGNSDHHVSILAPDGCTVNDFWLAQDLSARTITVAFGAQHNQCTESGFNTHGGAGTTAGGASLRVGRSPLAEMQTGVIHHALTAAPGCDLTSAYVGQAIYPGQYQACRPGVGGVGIPMGAYLWSDVSPGNLPSGLDKATKMICTALNEYGAVVDDTNGNYNGLSLNGLWSKVNTPGYSDWFAANAGTGGSTNPKNCFPGGDWSHHIHVLAW
jgi:hypothetical protein